MGYCQGLNYIANMFYPVCNYDESKTFEMILSFILNFNMQGMYMAKVSEYHVQNFVLQGLMKQHLPQLFNWITRRLELKLDSITTQWIMTIFMGFINDHRVILPILDNFILEKNPSKVSLTPLASWRVIFGYILALLFEHQPYILNEKELGTIVIRF